MCAFEELWRLLVEDIQSFSASAKEFVPTKTSLAIAKAIWNLQATQPRPLADAHALDVGTGTGVHALTMAACGYGHISAIDSSTRAVEHARKRWARLRRRIACSGDLPSPVPDIQFVTEALDSFSSLKPLSLVTFNPTAYFDFLNTRHESPISEAVYVDDDWRNGNLAENSALYRFFKHIVFPNLEVGGSAICTWFGLERRLVGYEKGATADQILHPVRILQRWFPEFSFMGNLSQGIDFYAETAQIHSDYGLGTSFKENLLLGYQAGLYSDLFSPGDSMNLPEFRFGVLHVVRTKPAPFLEFRIETETLSPFGEGGCEPASESPGRPTGYA